MRLYHFTRANNVLSILEQGFMPAIEPTLSPDVAVVWLTAQPDVSVLEHDARVMAAELSVYESPLVELQRLRADEIETFQAGPCRQWRYGSRGERLTMDIDGHERTVTFVPDEDDLVRLTVEIPDNDTKLHQYVKRRGRTKPNNREKYRFHIFYRLAHVRQWYVYCGRVVVGVSNKSEASHVAYSGRLP